MQGKLAQPLDVMAVVNKEIRTAEVVDVDQVWVEAYSINRSGKTAQFTVAFGGKDAKGTLHLCPERKEKMTRITIPDPLFSKLFLCPKGNLLRGHRADLDRAFAAVLRACNRLDWAMEEMVVHLDGEPVYVKQKGQPAPHEDEFLL